MLAFGILLATGAEAQKINSAPNFVGSGARALGMGGAFIAIADDATAASWNPGGLTQLERPELSIVYSWKRFNEEFAETHHISPEGLYSVDISELNYMSFAYPLPWTLGGRNLVFSLNYQTKYDFDRSLSFTGHAFNRDNSGWFHQSGHADFMQNGSLATFSPAAAIELTDKLSLGMAVNIWDSSLVGGNGWESVTQGRTLSNGVFQDGAQLTPFAAGYTSTVTQKYANISGLNYTFGMLYKPTGRLTFGAVYHTAYSTDVDYTESVSVRDYSNSVFQHQEYTTRLRIDWPASFGVGVAYRFPKDKFTISFDMTRRNWDSFVQTYSHWGNGSGTPFGMSGARLSPLTNYDKRLSPADPTYTLRLGGEYVFFNADKAKQKILPSVRAGIFWDPQPSTGRRVTESGISAATGNPDNVYGFALGAGVLLYNRVNIDLAYEYRRGDKVRRDTLFQETGVTPGFYENIEQHLVYLSTVIYF